MQYCFIAKIFSMEWKYTFQIKYSMCDKLIKIIIIIIIIQICYLKKNFMQLIFEKDTSKNKNRSYK